MTVTLITGANRGIGYQTARQLAEARHTANSGARDQSRGRQAAAELGGHVVQIDVTSDDSVNPVIVNISSGLGSFYAATTAERFESHANFIVYGATKAAVSMLTVQSAKALPHIRINAFEPGFTDTDFTADVEGGSSVAISATVVARMATIGPDGPTGTFREEGENLPW